MGRWRATASLLLNQYKKFSKNHNFLPTQSIPCCNCKASIFYMNPISHRFNFFNFRQFSAIPSRVSSYYNDFESASLDLSPISYLIDSKEDEEFGKIPVKAYFLCTSINLKSLQAENLINVVPATSRSSNYVALRYCEFPSEVTALGVKEYVACCNMVVFQYGSAVLFNVEDHEVESYLDIVRRHASGLLPEMRKDDYAIKEKPLLVEDMQGGPDYIVLKTLDTDSIRIIGSVLGQSIALDYFLSQIDGMVEVFAGINRIMENTGTFTMDRTELLRLVGKANSNLADVILKVGLFERSEIAWREAKYAQIYEYLREEFEVNQRFGNLDFKLKFVEHNIHFLLEVIQNRKSHLLEWAIVFLLIIENGIAFYEIFFRD